MEKNKKSEVWIALALAFQLGYIIALPAVIFALIGRLLDKKYNTSPYLLIFGLLIALIISSISVYKKSISILDTTAEKIKKQDKK